MSGERDVVHAVLEAWGAHPRLRIWRNNTGGAMYGDRFVKFGMNGAPDIMGVMSPSGRFVGIECKAPGKKQSADQIAWEAMFRAMGGVFVLARSVVDVDRVLIPLVGQR
jgi:hypothetical protein